LQAEPSRQRKGNDKHGVQPKRGDEISVQQLMKGALGAAAGAVQTGYLMKHAGRKNRDLRGIKKEKNQHSGGA
jgi:hypothetical protein